MSDDNPFELDAETMRAQGYRVVDHLIDRITGLGEAAAWRGATRRDLQDRVGGPAPSAPEGFDLPFARLRDEVLPVGARVDHPRFFAFVPGSPTWPGVLADFLAAGYNCFEGTWLGGGGASAIELIVLDWFREWLGLPESGGGIFTSGGSAATLIAVAAARQLRFGGHAADAVVYRTDETHSSVDRALRFLGFRPSQIRGIPVDAAQRMRVDALEAAIEEDARAGRSPFMIVASAGTTSTGAVDPLPEVAAVRDRYGLWLHTDAAYGGFAVLTERGRSLLAGLAASDSITLDPHKWLYQPFEAGCLLVRDVSALERAFRILPDYLRDAEVSKASPLPEVNFTDRGFQLTRQAKALKVWLSIQTFGLDAFRSAIDRSLDLALHAEARIRDSDVLELVSPASLGIVCFRTAPSSTEADEEARDERIIRALAASGTGMISSTRVAGRYTMRMCILSHRTRRADVDRVIDWVEAARRGAVPDDAIRSAVPPSDMRAGS